MDKQEIKAIYGELMGFLSQTPPQPMDKPEISLYDEAIWTHYNKRIQSLNDLTGKDYSDYILKPNHSSSFGAYINLLTYRNKLGGIISRLHAEYFEEMAEPFSGKPSIVVNQNQEQSQSVSVLLQTVVELRDKIDQQLPNYEEGTKEKGFLKKLKDSITTATSITNLMSIIVKLAAEFGISPDMLARFM